MPNFKFSAYIAMLCLLVINVSAYAQKPQQYNASEIYHELQKFNTLGKVLYLAAHPDDENQRIITYFSNERKVNAAYLSLTRGDGGQNLIGPEIREGLGIIRTQELLGARRVDGGQQFFSRANDFGYSKSADETLEIWNKSEVLSDVVWVIRQFRPDVIITRFPPDSRGGHGHHTSSALLAKAAFELAGDPNMYPEQLKYTQPWQPKRIFVNTGRWWNKTITEDTPGIITIDVGAYNELLGESYTEIAARSRSVHKSQGFGATGSRGEQVEFLEHMIGDKAKENDALSGVDLSWNRIEKGNKIGDAIAEIIEAYDFQQPALSVPALLKVRAMISSLSDQHWKSIKLAQVDLLLSQCMGLYFEMTANQYFATPGGEVKLNMELINRSGFDVAIEKIEFDNGTLNTPFNAVALSNNQKVLLDKNLKLPTTIETTQPYWLKEEGTLGMYNVKNQLLIGTPENKPCISAKATVKIDGQVLTYLMPLVYKWNDPVKGEQYKPFVVLPPVTVNVEKPVYIFKDNQANTLEVLVKAFANDTKSNVAPKLPQGWKVSPEAVDVQLNQNEEKLITFEITPPKGQAVATLAVEATVDGKTYAQSFNEIVYDHIPTQTYLPEATAKMVKLDVQIAGEKVAYIHGAGDDVPQALRNMGYVVDVLSEEQIDATTLSQYDAVMLGIRALNTNERIPFYIQDLLKYAENGGTLVMQYNTNHRLKTEEFAPYTLKLSRDRVSEESATVEILQPKHQVMQQPNHITGADFEGWVQERGLYFPNEWANEFEAILSMHDNGETAKQGSLLIAAHGKGHFVYTGLSFFRELPAGVPGAYRLLANIISLGNDKTNQ